VPEKNKDVLMKKLHRLKMEKNSKLMKDLNFNNKRIIHHIMEKTKQLEEDKKY
jgi:predicted RNA-binding protein Jag